MKNVCHITSVHRWDDTRIFFKECCTLAKSGWDVTLIAANGEPGMYDGVKLVVVKNNSTSRIIRATIVASRILLKCVKSKSNVVHFHDPELIWVGLILRILGKRVIYDVHENLRAQIEDKPWLRFPRLVKLFYNRMEFLSARFFKIVIAEESYAEIFAKYNITPTRVLNYPQIDALQRASRSSVSENSGNGILYVGLISRGRCFVEVVQALYHLKARNHNFHLHAVGPMEDGLMDYLEGMQEFRVLKEQIHFYGRLPVFEAYKLGEKCSCAISLLKPLPNYTRSFSTKIFEYMALGIPFLTSRFPIYQFIEDEGLGLLCNAEDYREIAANIDTIMSGGSEIRRMIESARDAVGKKYSWDSQAANLLGLYEQLMK
jgi:glycosyltransferase involved in cell wall biosynthesis